MESLRRALSFRTPANQIVYLEGFIKEISKALQNKNMPIAARNKLNQVKDVAEDRLNTIADYYNELMAEYLIPYSEPF